MDFEWDERKQQLNLDKHGLDFPLAAQLFDGRPVLHAPTLGTPEERYTTMGEINGQVVLVVWTWRCEVMRLISARVARRSERRLFHRAFLDPGD